MYPHYLPKFRQPRRKELLQRLYTTPPPSSPGNEARKINPATPEQIAAWREEISLGAIEIGKLLLGDTAWRRDGRTIRGPLWFLACARVTLPQRTQQLIDEHYQDTDRRHPASAWPATARATAAEAWMICALANLPHHLAERVFWRMREPAEATHNRLKREGTWYDAALVINSLHFHLEERIPRPKFSRSRREHRGPPRTKRTPRKTLRLRKANPKPSPEKDNLLPLVRPAALTIANDTTRSCPTRRYAPGVPNGNFPHIEATQALVPPRQSDWSQAPAGVLQPDLEFISQAPRIPKS